MKWKKNPTASGRSPGTAYSMADGGGSYAISEVFETLRDGDVVLWDCVTTWLTNAFTKAMTRGHPVYNSLVV